MYSVSDMFLGAGLMGMLMSPAYKLRRDTQWIAVSKNPE